jgi:hypothetical protein
MEQFESAHAVHSGIDPTIRIPVDPKSIQFAGELRPSWQIYPRAMSPRDGSQRLNRWRGMQKRRLPAMPANGRLMQTWLQLSCPGLGKAALASAKLLTPCGHHEEGLLVNYRCRASNWGLHWQWAGVAFFDRPGAAP